MVRLRSSYGRLAEAAVWMNREGFGTCLRFERYMRERGVKAAS